MLFWYQWRNVVAVANMAERVDGLISLKCGACYIILVRQRAPSCHFIPIEGRT